MKGEEVFKKASAFAEYAHRSVNQLRKYTNEPYIVHPTAVSGLVASVTSSMEVISAAILHDTIEDVEWVTGELITIVFGKRIANLVLCPVYRIGFNRVEYLSKSDRGEGGFGSTGIKGK